MKHKLFLFFLFFLSSSLVFSQADTTTTKAGFKKREKEPFRAEPDTSRHGFFNAKKFHSSAYFQAEGSFYYVLSKPAMLTSFGVTWTMNHKLTIGAKYSILTTKPSVSKYILIAQPDTFPVYPSQMSALLTVGYIIRSDKKFSIHPELGLGWANMKFEDYTGTQTSPAINQKSNSLNLNYFVFNPSVSLLWNATKYFRIGAVVGARGNFGSDYLRLKSYRTGGLYAGLFLRIGTF